MSTWISDAIIYQINWRAIATCEPRNPFEAAAEMQGTAVTESPIATVCKNLDVIEDLGVNVLYLMPLYPSGLTNAKGLGSPYSIRDFYEVSSEYGTKAELADLVRAAHARGLKVILDITPNHTSRDNPWLEERPDFYVQNADGSAFYDFDWGDTAKLDYTNPDLRDAMCDVYLHWLGFLGNGNGNRIDGMDGFRLDMAHLLNDLSIWDELMPVLKAVHPSRELLFLAECYGFLNTSDLFERGVNAAYDDDFYKVLQYGYAVDTEGHSRVALSEAASQAADFADALDAFQTGGIAGAMAHVINGHEERCTTSDDPCWLARYTDNHDEGRGLHRFGAGGVRAAMQLAFLSPHTMPFLLAGQEFGAINRPPIHARLCACDKGPRVVTEEASHTEPGVEFQGNLFAPTRAERMQWRAFYKALIALRKGTPELARGTFRLLDVGEDCSPEERSVIAFERQLDDRTTRCAVNLGPEPRHLNALDAFKGETLYGSLHRGGLNAFEAIVVRG